MSRQFALYDGHIIDPLRIERSDITLERIAHHLANINRFGGSMPLDVNYSVAEHSINLCRYVTTYKQKRYALLHDATEAFLGDIVSGLKAGLPEYMLIEGRLAAMIEGKYNVRYDPSINELDKRILIDEVNAIMPESYNIYKDATKLEELNCEIMFNTDKRKIKKMFLDECEKLNIKENK